MTAVSIPMMNEIGVAVFCGGIGGYTSGAMESQLEYGGELFKAKILCSVDFDPIANLNHDLITGDDKSITMDLFTRQQYIDWNGHEPPDDWCEMTPWDIWQAFGEETPFLLFSSPPCKGLSALLPKKSADTKKYQALNELVPRTLELGLKACMEFDGQVPAIIQLENVPRIQTRGKDLLKRITKLLKKFGYAVDMRADHNLGEVGGLGQNRLRFQIMARCEAQVPNFVYLPPKKQLLSIGDVIGPLPTPGDIVAGGPLHRLPNLQWKTWVRLALIPAGGDWRDLQSVPLEQYRIVHEARAGSMGVQDWDKPSSAVTSTAGPGRSNGAVAINDVRFGFADSTHGSIYRMTRFDDVGPTVTGAHRPNNGAVSVADPKLPERESRHPGAYRIVKHDETGPCVTGTRFGSGAIAVADPMVNDRDGQRRSNGYPVRGYDDQAHTITAEDSLGSGGQSIADPKVNTDLMPDSYGVHDWGKPGKAVRAAARIMNSSASISDPRTNDRQGRYTDQYRMRAMAEQAGAVTGVTDVQSGAQLVADLRFGCEARSGTMGVIDWDSTAPTVSASGDVYNGSNAVSDPRIPEDKDRGVWLLIAEDGTWHRPLTTYELAMLQGFDPFLPDGRPFQLEGCSDAKAREYIGNAYPKPAAKAVVNQVLLAAAEAKFKVHFKFSHDPVWVAPVESTYEDALDYFNESSNHFMKLYQ